MPLHLLEYSYINPQIGLDKPESNRYRKYGEQVMDIIRDNASRIGMEEFEYMADLAKFKKLVGNGFSVEVIRITSKGIPKQKLSTMIARKRMTCIIQGVTRYLVITQKKI